MPRIVKIPRTSAINARRLGNAVAAVEMAQWEEGQSHRFSVPPPPTANLIWRHARGRHFKSRDYQAWMTEAGMLLNAQRARPIPGPVSISIVAPENGRRDLDNYFKPTVDLLCQMQIIDGDRFKTVKALSARWHDQPAMLIEISALAGRQSCTASERQDTASEATPAAASIGLSRKR